MIVFLIYTVIFSVVIWWRVDDAFAQNYGLHRKQVLLLYLLKIMAVPTFYWVYKKQYGGIEHFDAGNYYRDVKVIAETLFTDPSFFFRALLGLQDDTVGSVDYVNHLVHTFNWDNGAIKDYFYNDNRVLIRVHSLLDVFTVGSYFAHALFNCTLSFVGALFLLRAFRDEFRGKELLFLLVLCLFPALWFYTGALLKEGLCVFFMGAFALGVSQLRKNTKALWLLLPSLFVAFFLKPYLLLSFGGFCTIYFLLYKKESLIFQVSALIGILINGFVLINVMSLHYKNRSVPEAMLDHQRRFEAVSRGGIFLTDSTVYMQLPADTNLIVYKSGDRKKVRLRPGFNYMYWQLYHPEDTLYARSEADTSKFYQVHSILPPSHSNLQLSKSSFGAMSADALFYSLFYPLFRGASTYLQVVASLENLVLLLCLVLVIMLIFRLPHHAFFPILWLCFVLGICLLVGLTAPNSGAIFRYRAPAVVFIPICAIYLLPLGGIFTKKSKQ